MLDPASGRPKRSSARARPGSNPNRSACGAKAMNSTAPTMEPASWPIARLIAPVPASARPTEVSALVQLASWSAIILRSCRNVRCSMATGAAASPADQNAQPEDPDHRGGGGRAHRGREGRRAQIGDQADHRAGQDRDAGHRRDDLARVARPPDDGQAHPELVEAQHRQQGHGGDGERAELLRAEHPGQHDADGQGAELRQRSAGEAPPQRTAGAGRTANRPHRLRASPKSPSRTYRIRTYRLSRPA